MNDNPLKDMLRATAVLFADGGMGTGLFSRGLMTGDCPELWNLDQPDRVVDCHDEFVAAGADILLTNSFGGNGRRLVLHQAQDRVAELNRAAAALARKSASRAGRRVLVAGAMGPTGDILEPIGPLSYPDAVAAFAEQGAALAEGGVDVLWIETISAAEEMQAARQGAARTGLPIVSTMTFDTNGRTMMGLAPAEALAQAQAAEPPPVAFGANCGIGPAELLATLLAFGASGQDPLIVAKGNCGIPQYSDGHIHYSGTPEVMAAYARLARDAGARIIGGCCGTTGTHLRAMVDAVRNTAPSPRPTLNDIVAAIGPVAGAKPRSGDGEGGRRTGRRRRTR